MKKEIKKVNFVDSVQFMAIFSEFKKLNAEEAQKIIKKIRLPYWEARISRKCFIRENKLVLQVIYYEFESYEREYETHEGWNENDMKNDFNGLVQIFEDILLPFD